MLCSDDKHPDDLVEGHINQLCARAVAKGVPLFHVLRAACVNPVLHYGLRNGILREGDPADFVRLRDLTNFEVLETFIDGTPVAREGSSLLPEILSPAINKFHCREKSAADFAIPATGRIVRVIEALDGQIVTGSGKAEALIENGQALADPSRDLLKITVVNRYADAPPAVAFVRGVGLREGAIASSVAHDCHNLVAVGACDEALARAINLLIKNQGGICVVDDQGGSEVLPLPIAGLMSNAPAAEVADAYSRLTQRAKALGSPLHAPFMTLSFLALLVIPSLKLGDRGLFDGNRFEFTPVFAD
jgi:adenine deaminase